MSGGATIVLLWALPAVFFIATLYFTFRALSSFSMDWEDLGNVIGYGIVAFLCAMIGLTLALVVAGITGLMQIT